MACDLEAKLESGFIWKPYKQKLGNSGWNRLAVPDKPSSPLEYFVFPKHGRPTRVTEALPRTKQELEGAIAEKFVRALRERFGRVLVDPLPGDDWPDFWTEESGAKIGIEVVEVVNPEHIAAGGYGAAQSVAVERANRLLIETVKVKIAKKYQNPQTWSLWLLVYDVTQALVGQDVAAHVANGALKTIDHPFAEIWLIWPTAEGVPSFLESVWPTTDFTSTERRD